MAIKHGVNEIALVEQPMHLHSRAEIRCLCGALIYNGPLLGISPESLESAYDKHMIGILEYAWVRQFYQAGA
jgi:hypothetical protein